MKNDMAKDKKSEKKSDDKKIIRARKITCEYEHELLELTPRPLAWKNTLEAKPPTTKNTKPFDVNIKNWSCGCGRSNRWYIAHVVKKDKNGLILRWDGKFRPFTWENLIPFEKAIPIK